MMTHDFSWLAHEANQIHQFFSSIFYLLVTVLLLLGLILNFFRLPLGEIPNIPVLVGRAFIAAVLLHTFPEFIEILRRIAEVLSERLGDINQFYAVRVKMADKLGEFSVSWVSVKETLTVGIAYIAFLLFHFSIYLADAFQLYTWVILYIFSPVLIAFYVLPSTSAATSALYRSLIEVSLWKPVWAVTATILWSTALSDINRPASDVNFISVICYCLILAGSLILTPFVVHALAGQGLSHLAKNLGTISLGATVVGPAHITRLAGRFARRSHLNQLPGAFAKRAYNASLAGGKALAKNRFPKLHQTMTRMPKFDLDQEQRASKKPSSAKK